jgi:carbohydrate kinase (thermoresistant glucokinase family)
VGRDDGVTHARAPRVVVMGVAGAGKSTVGPMVAGRLGVPFVDADDLHDEACREQMRRGQPLTDAQRAPWLTRVRDALAAHDDTGVVIACSALTPAYRAVLSNAGDDVVFVDLVVGRDELQRRLAARTGHFAGPALLDSQLRTLEVDNQVVTVDGEGSPSDVADAVVVVTRAATAHHGAPPPTS